MPLRALIIEDELLIALEIEAQLTELGFEAFDFAESPGQATKSALANRPDFITSDYRIVGGTGVEAVEEIIALLGPIPVAFITGSVSCLGSSMRAPVIDKPIMPGALARACRSAFGSQISEGSLVHAASAASPGREADPLHTPHRSLLDGAFGESCDRRAS